MTSYSGSVAYLEYVSETNKGDIKQNDVFNGVFGLGKTTEARTNFTAPVTIETIGSNNQLIMVAEKSGRFVVKAKNGDTINADVKITTSKGEVKYGKINGDIASQGHTKNTDILIYTMADGSATSGNPAQGDKVAYFTAEFQMDHTPASELPIIGPRMRQIALVAEPRRIAVKYDQITAFQA